MSDSEFLLVVTLAFCVLPLLCCTVGQRILARRAAAAQDKRRVWVVSCEERKSLAVVEVTMAGSPIVTDCSCWCDNSACQKTCLARLKATEEVRVATG
jgi:hypothetical protein